MSRKSQSASAEESQEAAERVRELAARVIDAFPYIIPEVNVNGCMGGKAEGYLSAGYLFLFKERVKGKLLGHLDTRNTPVFKGQDPVWNEMALALPVALKPNGWTQDALTDPIPETGQ